MFYVICMVTNVLGGSRVMVGGGRGFEDEAACRVLRAADGVGEGFAREACRLFSLVYLISKTGLHKFP